MNRESVDDKYFKKLDEQHWMTAKQLAEELRALEDLRGQGCTDDFEIKWGGKKYLCFLTTRQWAKDIGVGYHEVPMFKAVQGGWEQTFLPTDFLRAIKSGAIKVLQGSDRDSERKE